MEANLPLEVVEEDLPLDTMTQHPLLNIVQEHPLKITPVSETLAKFIPNTEMGAFRSVCKSWRFEGTRKLKGTTKVITFNMEEFGQRLCTFNRVWKISACGMTMPFSRFRFKNVEATGAAFEEFFQNFGHRVNQLEFGLATDFNPENFEMIYGLLFSGRLPKEIPTISLSTSALSFTQSEKHTEFTIKHGPVQERWNIPEVHKRVIEIVTSLARSSKKLTISLTRAPQCRIDYELKYQGMSETLLQKLLLSLSDASLTIEELVIRLAGHSHMKYWMTTEEETDEAMKALLLSQKYYLQKIFIGANVKSTFLSRPQIMSYGLPKLEYLYIGEESDDGVV